MDYRRPLRHQTTAARAFLVGACAGFAAGAVLVWLILSHASGSGESPQQAVERDEAPAIAVIAPPAGGSADPAAGMDVGRGGAESPTGTAGAADAAAPPAAPPSIDAEPAAELARRDLVIPVQGIRAAQLVPSFSERRGTRPHEAIDILAPRGTPVLAVEDGSIARLFYSQAGGITIYQFDPTERFCYYYAHLDRYAEGLADGQPVRKGQVIGYVGVSGNAPEDTPHLHFAIFRLTSAKRWWEGTPIDPFEVLRREGTALETP